jgi:hypothetical protein
MVAIRGRSDQRLSGVTDVLGPGIPERLRSAADQAGKQTWPKRNFDTILTFSMRRCAIEVAVRLGPSLAGDEPTSGPSV